MKYIYQLLCKDGRRYIGQTSNPSHRRSTHFYDLRQNRHSSKELQKAFNADNGSITFEIICQCKHNRDADLLSNYVHDRKWGLTDEEIETYFDEVRRTKAEIPEYVYDVHTIKGKRRGKTKADFFSDEEMALAMKQPSLFDIDFAAEG